MIGQAIKGNWQQEFLWLGPDWKDINSVKTSSVSFQAGNVLGAKQKKALAAFTKELADGLNLFTGPLNFQNGSQFLAAGATATDDQMWNLPQLLEGMEGASK